GAVSSGFVWGRSLGSGRQPARMSPLRSLSRMLSASTEKGPLGENGFAGQDNASVPPAEIYENVLEHVQREFVADTGGSGRISNGALSRMLASLDDPKTGFLEPALRQARQDALQGRFRGIGAALTITKSKKEDVDYRHLTVVSVMPNSPAEKA